MRKFIILALVLGLGLSMAACGQGGSTADTTQYPGGVDYSTHTTLIKDESPLKVSDTTFKASLGNILENDQLKVVLDGKDLAKGTDYTLDAVKGVFTFTNPVGEGADLKVTFSADNNPATGLLVTNTPPTDGRKFIQPKNKEDLVGEIIIPPDPVEYLTCYDATNVYRPKDPTKPDIWTVEWKYSDGTPVALDPIEAVAEVYPGWTKVPQTREMYEKGILHKLTFDETPDLSWWMWFELKKEIDWGKLDYFEKGIEGKLTAQYPDAKIIANGQFKHTQSDAKGSWVEYTFTKDGAPWKGRILFYALRGVRLGETTFGDGQGIYAQAEGPAAAFDAAWKTGNMLYMFQQMLITTPAPQSAQ